MHHTSLFSLLELIAKSALRIRYAAGLMLAAQLYFDGLPTLAWAFCSRLYFLWFWLLFLFYFILKIFPKLDLVLYCVVNPFQIIYGMRLEMSK